MTIRIEGLSVKVKPGATYPALWRLYGTRRGFTYPGGRLAPQPGTWEHVLDVPVTVKRGRVEVAAAELEPTGPGGWLFYNKVAVDAEGRETWHPNEEMTLTPEMVEEFGGELDFGSWFL